MNMGGPTAETKTRRAWGRAGKREPMKNRRWILPLVLAALLVLAVGIVVVAVWWARTIVAANEQNLANERGNVRRLHGTVEYFHEALGAKTEEAARAREECERLQAELERIRPASTPRAVVDAWPVVRIVDGDTIRVRYEGRDEPVRLLCIDTPERGKPGFGAAAVAMRGLVEGRAVVLEFERQGEMERDRYGRLLAYVFVDGRNVNVEMVRLGLTPFWTKYGRGRYAEDFEIAEAEAKAEKRGLWGNAQVSHEP